MYRSFYEGMTYSWLPQATTLFFVAFFVAVLVRFCLLRAKADFDPVASLPLKDDASTSSLHTKIEEKHP